MRLKKIVQELNELFDSQAIPDACPNGLQVEGKEEVCKIGTAVSASLATIEAAITQNIDLLITHHGLFWEKDPYPIVGAKKQKLQQLLKHEISLLAYHLPMDIHSELGNNWRASQELKWEQRVPFGWYHGMQIGVQGKFAPLPIEALIAQLEAYYHHSAATALGGNKIVSSAALISGGAYRELRQAVAAGIDCFITGNFDEPAWHMAFEEHINFIALGHSATERIGPRALAEYIQSSLGIETRFLDIPNPF